MKAEWRGFLEFTSLVSSACSFKELPTDGRVLANEYEILTPAEPVTDLGTTYTFSMLNNTAARYFLLNEMLASVEFSVAKKEKDGNTWKSIDNGDNMAVCQFVPDLLFS